MSEELVLGFPPSSKYFQFDYQMAPESLGTFLSLHQTKLIFPPDYFTEGRGKLLLTLIHFVWLCLNELFDD